MKPIAHDAGPVDTDRIVFRILRLVRDHDVISRVEISQILGISKATVTWTAGRLLEKGYLENVGTGTSSSRGGRKRQLLRFNPRARYAIGVDIRLRSAGVALADLNASIVERETIGYDPERSPEEILGEIRGVLLGWRKSRPDQFSRALGIGIGMPGVIDEERGVVRVADALRAWRDVNLKRYFEDETGLETFVENDVKTMTVGEYLFGAGRHVPDHVLLYLGDGIGAGIILGGRLHRGITSSAGEVGFNALGCFLTDPDRFPNLVFGQKDFGDTLSDARFVAAYNRVGGRGRVTSTDDLIKTDNSGDEIAHGIIREASDLISIVCIDLINTLNPEVIILAGQITRSEHFLRSVQEKVKEDILSVPAEAVHIVRSKLGEDAILRGAVGLVLYDLFKPIRVLSRAKGGLRGMLLK